LVDFHRITSWLDQRWTPAWKEPADIPLVDTASPSSLATGTGILSRRPVTAIFR
jgi:hypothetical protein